MKCRRVTCPRTANHCGYCYSHHRDRKKQGLAGLVDAQPVIDHILKLYPLGWDDLMIAEFTGLAHRSVKDLRDRKQCRAVSANAILAIPLDERGSIRRRAHPIPVVRRINAMQARGWGHTEIGQLSGLTLSALSKIVNGARQPTFATAQAIRRVYEEVGDTLGPSRKAVLRAARRGYLPPAAWNDIDDLEEVPDTGKARQSHGAPVDELVFLNSCGESVERLSQRFGVSEGWIQQKLKVAA